MDNFSGEKYTQFIKEHLFVVGLGIVGLLFIGYGVFQLLPQSEKQDDISFETIDKPSMPVKSAKSSVKTEMMQIDVEGAVRSPGVYKLSSDSRVKDALIAAGGLSEKADKGKIATGLNLASKITDGSKIYLPFEGEDLVSTVGNGSSGSVLGDASTTGQININTASATELDSLSGVGKVTADKIVGGRPYTSIDDLLSKKIVGKSVFEKIKDKIKAN